MENKSLTNKLRTGDVSCPSQGRDKSISTSADVLHITEPKTRKIPSKSWRECVKKVWEVDPLECTKCGAEMKIISFIDERLLIRRILEHLDLWQERIPKGLPPPVTEIPETMVCEEFDDGWGRRNDQDVTLH